MKSSTYKSQKCDILLLSARQLKDWLRWGEPTFMVVLLDWNQDYFKVLDELTDLLPDELPKLLSLRRAIDH